MTSSAKTILVVDDEPGIRETYAAIFRIRGYEVLTAKDGVEALEILSTTRAHVLVSDLKMPRMNGFELLSVVRDRFPEMGVIAISGHYAINSQQENLMTDAFFAKGGEGPDALLKKIAELMEQYPIRRPHSSADVPFGHGSSA
jgi:DNA-binding NtrC family response regulator